MSYNYNIKVKTLAKHINANNTMSQSRLAINPYN